MVNEKTVKEMGTFDITPDVHLIQSLGQKGYIFWQAMSELIDNAIDARREDAKPLLLEVQFGPKDTQQVKWIEIRDYGTGMNYVELEKCMKLGYVDPKKSRDSNRLGKFGLGLKTACSSLGSKFSIKTKHYQNETAEVLSIIYDESKFIKGEKWEIQPNREIDKDFRSGTVIRIENLNDRGTTVYFQKVERMIEMFSMEYGPRIKTGELKIVVDTLQKRTPQKTVEPYVYDLLHDERHELDFTVDGKRVKGWVGFVKAGHKGLSKGFFGFNLFWKNRIVALHTKIGFRPHAETWRLVGELHLDDFPITNDKKDFIWSHEAMQKLTGPEIPDEPEGTFNYERGALHKHLESVLKKFEFHKQERRAVKNDIKDAILSQKLPVTEGRHLIRILDSEKITPAEVRAEIPKIIQKYSSSKDKEVAQGLIHEKLKEIEERSGTLSHTREKIEIDKYSFDSPIFEFFVFINGKKRSYSVYHETKTLGPQSDEFIIEQSKENEIVVISNVDHPSIAHTEDLRSVYDRQKVEAITIKLIELKQGQDNIDHFLETRDKVWREYIKQKQILKRRGELEKEKKEIEEESTEF